MAKVMLTVQLPSDQATVEGARSKLGLSDDDLDPGFGVVPIDPDRDLYAVLVEESLASRASAEGLAGGPFANPTIEPFGPSGTVADPSDAAGRTPAPTRASPTGPSPSKEPRSRS